MARAVLFGFPWHHAMVQVSDNLNLDAFGTAKEEGSVIKGNGRSKTAAAKEPIVLRAVNELLKTLEIVTTNELVTYLQDNYGSNTAIFPDGHSAPKEVRRLTNALQENWVARPCKSREKWWNANNVECVKIGLKGRKRQIVRHLVAF